MTLGLSRTFLLALIVIITGTRIRLACYKALGRFFTFELALKPDHTLITSGPYAVVRHPSYAGAFVGMCGATLIHMGPGSYWMESGMRSTASGVALGVVFWAYVAVIFGFLFARTRKEDAVMRKEFKDQWEAWTKKTQYLLLPLVY